MARIQPIQPEQAGDAARKLLDAVKRQLGLVPNIFKTLARSPAVLDAYMKQMSALRSGPHSLDRRTAFLSGFDCMG